MTPKRATGQIEGSAVGEGDDEDGVHHEQQQGEGAGGQQGGQPGGLGHAGGGQGDHQEGEEEDEEARGGLAGWEEKGEDAKTSEQGGGDDVPLQVHGWLSVQVQCVGDIQVRLWAAFVEHLVSFPLGSY